MADCKETNEELESKSKPQITMKIDSPEESSDNSANDDAEKVLLEKDSDSSCSSNSMPNNISPTVQHNHETKLKGSILTASRFGTTFGVNASNASSSKKPYSINKPCLLRPSALGSVTNSSTTKSVLKPATFLNPFTKVTNNSDDENESFTTENNKDQEKSRDSEEEGQDKKKEDEKDENEKKKDKEPEVPKFLALSKSPKDSPVPCTNSSVPPAASVSTPSFVFGQNLKARVTVAEGAEGSENSEQEESTSNENGSSSEYMFSNAAAVAVKTTTKPGMTLTQAAQEAEEANRASKRKYSEVALLTGEEDETNILQINCKLFAFDKASSSYQERGRGSLRLNDKDDESRLIGRAAGTQRLVLNTKVWPGMTAERAGPKSLRLTAMDAHGEVRIFVVQANQNEVEQLHNLLVQRLKRAQERQPKKLAAEH